MFCIIGIFLSQIEKIYAALGQDEEISRLATKFVHTTFPFHICETVSVIFCSNFAIPQRVTHYMVITLATGTICHAIMSYYFVFVRGLGFDGVCYATALMFMIRGAVGFTLVKCSSRF